MSKENHVLIIHLSGSNYSYFTMQDTFELYILINSRPYDNEMSHITLALTPCCRLHGSYQALRGGYSQDALVDFSGGIGEILPIKPKTDMSEQFKLISKLIERNSILCTGTVSILWFLAFLKCDKGSYVINGSITEWQTVSL